MDEKSSYSIRKLRMNKMLPPTAAIAKPTLSMLSLGVLRSLRSTIINLRPKKIADPKPIAFRKINGSTNSGLDATAGMR